MKALINSTRSIASAGAVALLAVAALGFGGAAQARDNVYWSIGVGTPGAVVNVGNVGSVYPQPVYVQPGYGQPQPVYVQPRPVYVQPQYVEPQPVYYERSPLYVRPAPVYVAPQPVYYGRPYEHGHEHRGNGYQRNGYQHNGYQQNGYQRNGYAPNTVYAPVQYQRDPRDFYRHDERR